MSSDSLRAHFACVRCAASLDLERTDIVCARCAQSYTRVGRIPVLLPRADDHVTLWREQLATLRAQGEHTLAAIREELESPGLTPSGHARLRALSQALGDQVRDIVSIVGPALGGPRENDNQALPRGVVEYIQFLYRDWGWDKSESGENARALDALRALSRDRAWGRTLVLGAGAGRLAYDAHRALGATETALLDIDPFLFVIAEAVVRGEQVQLTESTANVQELGQAAKTWQLSAPAGPLGEREFQFILANALAPPFDDHVFDTVLTPWFIDQVSGDLLAFFGRVRRLLKPGGHWLNTGPLLYPPDLPLARRYSKEEIFELAQRVGFRILEHSVESRPHLKSPLNGRGKIEWILSFSASS